MPPRTAETTPMNHNHPASILFDARTVQPGMTGVGRYTLNLLRALSTLPDGPTVRALMRPD